MKKIFTIINIVAFSFAVYAIYSVSSDIFGSKQKFKKDYKIDASGGKNIVVDKKKVKSFSHYGNVKKRNLFGTKKNAPETSQQFNVVAPVDIPVPIRTSVQIAKLKSKFQLRGTIITPKDKTAIINSTKKRKEDLYKIGDKLDKNIIILDIMRGEILISIDGNKHTIRTSSGISLKKLILKRQKFIDKYDEERLIEKTKLSAIIKNTDSITKDIEFVQYTEDGKPAGLIIKLINSNSFFKSIGLKKGDVLKKINDIQVNNFLDFQRFYYAQKDNGSLSNIKLIIKRQGMPYKIRYTIK